MLRFLRYAAVPVLVLLALLLHAQTPKTHHAQGSPTAHKAGSRSSTKQDVPEPAHYVLVAAGSFQQLQGGQGKCTGKPALATCVKLLVNAEEEGSVEEAAFRDSTHLVVGYSSTKGEVKPTDLLLGTPNATVHFPYVTESAATAMQRELPLSGDFCRPLADGHCTSKLFHDDVAVAAVTGYVSGPDGANRTPLEHVSLQQNIADVTFTASPDFHPVWLVLQAGDVTEPFPYVQAAPTAETSAVYAISNLSAICGSSCPADTLFTLSPLTPGVIGKVELLSRQGELLFTSMRTYNGTLPPTLAVVNNSTKQSTLARLLTKPSSDQSEVDVRLTVMDQETMRRNYGSGLAQTYTAVKLDLTNRTEKKLQFNKSAVWFDADFIETSAKNRERTRNKLSDATFDFITANVYDNPFSTKTCEARHTLAVPTASSTLAPLTTTTRIVDKYQLQQQGEGPLSVTKRKVKIQNTSSSAPAFSNDCKLYRFGIEQTERFHADGPLSILGSFDYLTQRTDRAFRAVELFGSLLTTIATGSAVAQVHNTAFRDATAIFTGTAIPGARTILMNTAEINRQRANLAAQTFQEFVQIAPHSSTSTILLLPREALINVQGYDRLVVLDKVLDVHLETDVINGVKDPPVPAGKMSLGYTKGQVRQALGEPQTVQTTPDDTSTFGYSQGPYQTVNFNKDGQAVTWVPRSLSDQLSLADTLAAAKDVLKVNSSTGKELTLLDKNIILVDVPGVTVVQRYDSTGKRTGAYKLLYDDISAGRGKTKLEFEKMLGQMKLPKAVDQMIPAQMIRGQDTWTTYDMPDIKGGTIHVEYNGVIPSDKSKDGPTVKEITFTGEKPGIQ